MDKILILLVGIGGYGEMYLNELLDNIDRGNYTIIGIVDPRWENCSRIDDIRQKNIPIFKSMENFYSTHKANLVIISSPIQYHCSQTCLALSNGSSVLCEKPACATVQDVQTIIDKRDETGGKVAIGFQWSYSDAVQKLKKRIIERVFGKSLQLRALVLWPRTYNYYHRSKWAGRKKDEKGNWILDSVANNATAHFLHNMFYVLGEKVDSSVRPRFITAELYRANSIENFDTCATRVIMENGVEIFYYATHATKEFLGPMFCYEFEKANIMYDQAPNAQINAQFKDGSIEYFGDPFKNNMNKLWQMVEAVNGGIKICCPPEAALSHTLSVNGMHESMPGIVAFPKDMIVEDNNLQGNEKGIYAKGLIDVLKQCYEEKKLPSELGVSWAKTSKRIDLTNYKEYKG